MTTQTTPAYQIAFTQRTEAVAYAYVTKPDGTVYAAVLSGAAGFCSCPDSMYRGRECKHQKAVRAELCATYRAVSTPSGAFVVRTHPSEQWRVVGEFLGEDACTAAGKLADRMMGASAERQAA